MTILVTGGTGHLERAAGQPPNVHIDRRESQMSSAQESSNKATFRRFHDATNSGDVELIAKTIDELVEPDAVIHTPLPIEATGAQLLKDVFARLLRAYPDLHNGGVVS